MEIEFTLAKKITPTSVSPLRQAASSDENLKFLNPQTKPCNFQQRATGTRIL